MIDSGLITVIVIIVLFLTLIFSRRLHRFINGILLLGIGVLPTVIKELGLRFEVTDFPVIQFAAFFLLLYASKDIFVASFKEDNSMLKFIYFIFALFLIAITTIPTLYSMEVITFTIPYIIETYYNAIYLVTGIFLIIGTFMFD